MKLILRTVVVDRHIYFRNKRKWNFASISLFVLSYVMYLKYTFGPTFSFTKWDWKDDITCYGKKDDALPSINDMSPSSKSIFFNDPSCNIKLWEAKDTCVVESAARAHPNWNVYVLFNNPLSKEDLEGNSMLKILKKLPNVKLARVNIEDYSMGTPAEGFVSSGGLNETECPILLNAGLIKYITLYKWGGIVLERDMIVTKPLSSLARNWVTRLEGGCIGPGMLAFAKDEVGENVAETALRDIVKNHKSFDCENGENVMVKIVNEQCSTPDPESKSAAVCNGFEIYGPQFFYPIDPLHAYEYFEHGELPGYDTAYTYYLWSRLTSSILINKQISSRYTKLAKKHCPATYYSFPSKF